MGDENTWLSELSRYIQTEEAEKKELSVLCPSVYFDRNTRYWVRRRRLSVDSETCDNCEFTGSHVGVGSKTMFCKQQL